MTGAMELQPDDGPRSSLGIVPGFGRCSGISLEFARRFAEWIEKLAGRSPEEDRKTRHKNVGGCRIGGTGGCTAVALVFGRLTRPGWAVEPLVPKCSGD
ncbi:hypothetical protein GW17_00033460 [Ensete ventricosum]|nr:hypothetical protein GW17_00033460 [Ensete ventricosum]